MIDGIVVAEQCCVAALVITASGQKVPVGLWLGDTENKTVVTDLLGYAHRECDAVRGWLPCHLIRPSSACGRPAGTYEPPCSRLACEIQFWARLGDNEPTVPFRWVTVCASDAALRWLSSLMESTPIFSSAAVHLGPIPLSLYRSFFMPATI